MKNHLNFTLVVFFPFVFFLGFSIAQINSPDWIFYCDFESGNKDIWDDYDDNPDYEMRRVFDPGPEHKLDNHVFRFSAPSGERGGYDLTKILPASYEKLYARWYVKYEPGFNFNAPNHGGGYMLEIGIFWADPNGSCWGDSYPCIYDYPDSGYYCTKMQHLPEVPLLNLVENKWYCIEIMLVAGTPSPDGTDADGQMELWIDGQTLGHWDDLWFRTTPDLSISILWLNLFHHDGTHSDSGVLYDEVVVSTKRIGPINSILPTAPSNLDIIRSE